MGEMKKFEIWYSDTYKLYDIVIEKDGKFHGHYHISNKKDILKLIGRRYKNNTE
jgi:hypothetical protein